MYLIAPEGTVRLADGSNAYEGRVEVYANGTWGIVCDDEWSMNNGHVVCHQLGFSRASSIHQAGEFGTGMQACVSEHAKNNILV